MILLLGIAYFTACEKDALQDESSLESYLDETLFHMEEEGGFGRLGCFELVFPLSIQLPDSSIAKVTSYEELGKALLKWKTRHPRGPKHILPFFVFPIDVLTDSGEVVTLNNFKELHDLKETCAGEFDKHGPKGHKDKCTPCFEFVFPITIKFPDSTSVKVETKEAFIEAIRTWKKANPTVKGRPEVAFPVDVKMKDGSTVKVNNVEELIKLKQSCRP
jgi:hypothetical protein